MTEIKENVSLTKDPFVDLTPGITQKPEKKVEEKIVEPEQVVVEPEKKAEPVTEPEKKIEEKVTEPEKKVEEKVVEPEWYEKQAEEKKVVETDKKVDGKPEIGQDVLKEVERVKKLSENKYNKAVIDLLEKGMTLDDIQAELKGPDPSKMSDKDLYARDLADLGLNEEEQKEELDKFDGMSTAERKRLVNPVKERLKQENMKKLEQLGHTIPQEKIKFEAIVQKAQSELKQKLSDITGKEMYGLEMTPERVKVIEDFINNDYSDRNTDGSFNTEFLFKVALTEKYLAQIVQANVIKAKNSGKKEVLDEVTRADKNTNLGQDRIPDTANKAKKEEKDIDDWAKSWNHNR